MAQVFFNGGTGKIECNYIGSDDKQAPIALVLQPKSIDGSMHNTIVTKLYGRFAKHHFSVLRMNFRGVGKSAGSFDNGVGEILDASLAIDWLLNQNPSAKIAWVAGFSFSAWVAMQIVMRRPEVNNFIIISPPTNKYDFSFLSPCPSGGLIIYGDNDSIVPEASITEFIDKLSKQDGSKQDDSKIECKVVKGADHFFRGKEDALDSILDDYIERTLKKQRFLLRNNDILL